jgi:hypothetical protein
MRIRLTRFASISAARLFQSANGVGAALVRPAVPEKAPWDPKTAYEVIYAITFPML